MGTLRSTALRFAGRLTSRRAPLRRPAPRCRVHMARCCRPRPPPRAGHSVAVLLRVYAKCISAQEEEAKRCIAEATQVRRRLEAISDQPPRTPGAPRDHPPGVDPYWTRP